MLAGTAIEIVGVTRKFARPVLGAALKKVTGVTAGMEIGYGTLLVGGVPGQPPEMQPETATDWMVPGASVWPEPSLRSGATTVR